MWHPEEQVRRSNELILSLSLVTQRRLPHQFCSDSSRTDMLQSGMCDNALTASRWRRYALLHGESQAVFMQVIVLGSLMTLGKDCKVQVSTALNTAKSLYYPGPVEA